MAQPQRAKPLLPSNKWLVCQNARLASGGGVCRPHKFPERPKFKLLNYAQLARVEGPKIDHVDNPHDKPQQWLPLVSHTVAGTRESILVNGITDWLRQRLTFDSRSYNTTSNRTRIIKTPGGDTRILHIKKRGTAPKCGDCGVKLPGVSLLSEGVLDMIRGRRRDAATTGRPRTLGDTHEESEVSSSRNTELEPDAVSRMSKVGT